MRLQIKGKTNKDYVMVNTAKLTLPSGTVITIDRERTEFSIYNGEVDMLWCDCYFWECEACLDYIQQALKSKDKCSLELELEDDADDDYEFFVTEWQLFFE